MVISGCTTPSTTGEARKIRGSDDYNPRCGDNRINQPSEECDGSRLGGKTCGDFGFTEGTLSCTSQCKFNTNQCSGVHVTEISPDRYEVISDKTPSPIGTPSALVICFPNNCHAPRTKISHGGDVIGLGRCDDYCPSEKCIQWICTEGVYDGCSTLDTEVSYEIICPDGPPTIETGQEIIPPEPACGDGSCNGNENCHNCRADCGKPINTGSPDYLNVCP